MKTIKKITFTDDYRFCLYIHKDRNGFTREFSIYKSSLRFKIRELPNDSKDHIILDAFMLNYEKKYIKNFIKMKRRIF